MPGIGLRGVSRATAEEVQKAMREERRRQRGAGQRDGGDGRR